LKNSLYFWPGLLSFNRRRRSSRNACWLAGLSLLPQVWDLNSSSVFGLGGRPPSGPSVPPRSSWLSSLREVEVLSLESVPSLRGPESVESLLSFRVPESFWLSLSRRDPLSGWLPLSRRPLGVLSRESERLEGPSSSLLRALLSSPLREPVSCLDPSLRVLSLPESLRVLLWPESLRVLSLLPPESLRDP